MEEENIDDLYGTVATLAGKLSLEPNALPSAAVLNAVSMSIYKTTLSESDYDKMCETIFDLRHDIKTFEPVWEEEGGTVH